MSTPRTHLRQPTKTRLGKAGLVGVDGFSLRDQYPFPICSPSEWLTNMGEGLQIPTGSVHLLALSEKSSKGLAEAPSIRFLTITRALKCSFTPDQNKTAFKKAVWSGWMDLNHRPPALYRTLAPGNPGALPG
jgi:hypothetical protein